MTLEHLIYDRKQWDELAQIHGLWIVAADETCLHVSLHSGARTFALNRAALTKSQYPGDAFETAARRLHRGHIKLTA